MMDKLCGCDRIDSEMRGYTCEWCGGGHLGVDCPHKPDKTSLAYYQGFHYMIGLRMGRYARRLRSLVVALQGRRRVNTAVAGILALHKTRPGRYG